MVVDTSGFDESGRGCVLVRARPMVLALVGLADLLWDLGSPLSRRGGSSRTAEARDQKAEQRQEDDKFVDEHDCLSPSSC